MISISRLNYEDLTIGDIKAMRCICSHSYDVEKLSVQTAEELLKMLCRNMEIARVETSAPRGSKGYRQYIVASGGLIAYAVNLKTYEVVFFGFRDEDTDEKIVVDCFATDDKKLVKAVNEIWDTAYETLNETV